MIQLIVGQAFNVNEEVLADRRKDPLPRFLQDHGLQIGGALGNDQHAHVEQHLEQQRVHLELLLHEFLHVADDPGRNEVKRDRKQH